MKMGESEVVVSIDWKQLAGFITVMVAAFSGLFWVIYHKLKDKLDGVYMTKKECKSTHQVTDVKLVEMRDDIKEMKDTNKQILKVLLESRDVFTGGIWKTGSGRFYHGY